MATEVQVPLVLSQKGIIPGFPHWSEKIPTGTQHEDIIKKYPNHLRGDLLLQIAAFWTPKEISTTSGLPNLLPNAITKRIKAARIQKARPQTTIRHKRTVKPNPANPPFSTPHPATLLQQPQFAPEAFTESDASRQFRLQQQELRDIMQELDSTWAWRNLRKGRKSAHLDRALAERAAVERERRLRVAQKGESEIMVEAGD